MFNKYNTPSKNYSRNLFENKRKRDLPKVLKKNVCSMQYMYNLVSLSNGTAMVSWLASSAGRSWVRVPIGSNQRF